MEKRFFTWFLAGPQVPCAGGAEEESIWRNTWKAPWVTKVIFSKGIGRIVPGHCGCILCQDECQAPIVTGRKDIDIVAARLLRETAQSGERVRPFTAKGSTKKGRIMDDSRFHSGKHARTFERKRWMESRIMGLLIISPRWQAEFFVSPPASRRFRPLCAGRCGRASSMKLATFFGATYLCGIWREL